MRRKFGLLVGAMVLVAVVSAGSATAYAVGPADARCDAFIDEDGDGICDNCGNGVGFIDEDGDGICDNCGNGAGFIDEDGDGICDNWDAETGRGNGSGGNGRGNGCGRNCWR